MGRPSEVVVMRKTSAQQHFPARTWFQTRDALQRFCARNSVVSPGQTGRLNLRRHDPIYVFEFLSARIPDRMSCKSCAVQF
jgi:hypothetical protein